jgi:Yip1-like protein
METGNIISRAKSILLSPKTEWPIIAAESDSAARLYTGYILIMAAIPAVVRFLSATLIGISVPFMGTYRVPVVSALTSAILAYVFTLIGVYVVALIVDALAPTFNGEKNRVQALKTVAYAYTSSWVASIIGIIPGLLLLAALVGAGYGIYLLRLGLPVTMKCPDDKAVGYTAATIVVAIVIAVVINLIVASILRTQGYYGPGAVNFTPH